MFNHFFNSQTKSISGATGILAISYIISGLLGLFRDRLLAGIFGAGIETSIYFAAFRIPDLVYNILILGGISVAFLPLLAEYFSKDKAEAWRMTNYVLNIFLFLLALTSLVLFIFTPWLIKFITPGFTPENKTVAITLTRMLFFSPIFLGISSLFSGILQYFNRFLVYSLAPILYNLGIIFGVSVLSPHFGILGAGLGVILGVFLHLIIQIPSAINCGFRYNFLFDFKYPAIKRIVKLMIPRVFGIAANQVNLIVITAFASTIAAGSIAIFNFSNNLRGLPVGILGSSLAIAVFPTFSRFWANGQKKEFVEKFSSIFRQTIFVLIPTTILMFLLRAQIVRIILGTGHFGWEETRLTAASLGLFSFSIFASASIPFLARAFFSFQNTKIPALAAVIFVSFNIGLSLFFIHFLSFPNFVKDFMESVLKLQGIGNISVVGLPLAFSIASIFQFFFLLFFLYKKIGDFGIRKILNSTGKILIAGISMAMATYFSLRISAIFIHLQTFWEVFGQAFIAALIGVLVYILLSKFLKIEEQKIILERLKSFF